MSHSINSKCVACDRCRVQCPQNAITRIDDRLSINPNLCNDCTSSYSVAQCAAVCPANACFPSLDPANYWDSWFNRYQQAVNRVKTHQHPQYWINWFDCYTEKLTQLVN